ncbi:hypothetical protein LL037_21200 [Clostridium estertheticum]|uniref:hypothetical protein n=1 Tax=Clostridium estertheticum TaxID=238834 RepID=UPI001C0BD3E3|nr:hypothetical protein [Clostridium estertheticum]MBU3198262.1 hypothetical protein [Clostridium estertheticum]WAG64953.1 hypothetical protein LL037_21200 [Clostridium estertheticum]
MNNSDKDQVGEEAKESIKQLFKTLLLDDLKKISLQNHMEIKEDIKSVKMDVTSELKVPIKNIIENIDELKVTNSSIIEKIEDANSECLDEIEKIAVEKSNITQTVINDNNNSLLSEVNKRLDLKIDGINGNLYTYNNKTLDSIRECKDEISKRQLLIEDKLKVVSELFKSETNDLSITILSRVDEIEVGYVKRNDELIKLYEQKDKIDRKEILKREKKSNILFGIVIGLLFICGVLIIFIK